MSSFVDSSNFEKQSRYLLNSEYTMPMYLIYAMDLTNYFSNAQTSIDLIITKDINTLWKPFEEVMMNVLKKKNLLKQLIDQIKKTSLESMCGPIGAKLFAMSQIFKEHKMHGMAFIASVLLAVHIHNIKGETGVIYGHLRNPLTLYTIARESDDWEGYNECTKLMREQVGSSGGSLNDFLYLCIILLFSVHTIDKYGFIRSERFYTIFYKHLFNSKIYDNDPAIAINLSAQVSGHVGMLGYQNGFPAAYYYLRLAGTLLKRKGKLNHSSYKEANKIFNLLCIFYCGKLLEFTNFTWSCNKKRDEGKALSEIELKQLRVLDFDENFGVELAATSIEMLSQACSNPDEVRKVFNVLKNAQTEIKKLGGWKIESRMPGMQTSSTQMAHDAIQFAKSHFRFLR